MERFEEQALIETVIPTCGYYYGRIDSKYRLKGLQFKSIETGILPRRHWLTCVAQISKWELFQEKY